MQLLVMVGMSLLLMLAVSLVVAALQMAGLADAGSLPMLYVTQVLSQVLCFALPPVLTVLVYYRTGQREFYRLDLGGRSWWKAFVCVVAALLLTPLIDALSIWNDGWHFGGSLQRLEEAMRAMQQSTEALLAGMMAGDGVGTLVLNLVVVALFAAVSEELFFRVGIQNLLQRWWQRDADKTGFGAHAAVWVTAAVFSLTHGEIFAFMPRFVLGLLLGYAYLYGRSLVCNVLVHFVNNAIVVVLYWLSARGVGGIDPEATLDCGWPVVACCALAALTLLYVELVIRGKSESKKLKINE